VANYKTVAAVWLGRSLVFQSDVEGKPPVIVDGNSVEGPSPVDALLIALAGCTGSDVVEILLKKRLDLQELRIEVNGTRRDEYPRRFTALDLVFRVTAPGAGVHQVRQAIDLSLQKYCSVTHSLNPDIPVRYELVLQA
jgi:putative redox protein